MPVGRKPKPTAVKVLEGNPGRRPLNDQEPKPARVIPSIPRGLPKRAREFLKQYMPELDRVGLVTAIDGPVLIMMALAYSMAHDAADIIKKEGVTRIDQNGVTRKHPMFQVWRENSRDFLRYATEFGMTPSSRSRIRVPEMEDSDDFFGF